MRMRTIQGKMMVWTMLCILLTVGGLVTYATYGIYQSELRAAHFEIKATGHYLAREVQDKLAVALDSARAIADALIPVAAKEDGMNLTRTQVNAMLKSILIRNPIILGTYTIWEPNTFDGRDAELKGNPKEGPGGIFAPYWTRDQNGTLGYEALDDFESLETDEWGMKKGDYWFIPRDTKREVVLDPFPYDVQGKKVVMASMVVPIVWKDKFYGVTGADVALWELQKSADKLNLLEGTGKLILMGGKGKIAASTGQPEHLGKHITQVDPQGKEIMQLIQEGKPGLLKLEGQIKYLIPLNIGQSSANWMIMLSIPESKLTEKAISYAVKQILMGTFMVLIGSVLLWVVGQNITRRLKRGLDTVQALSKGNLDSDCQSNAEDEVGDLLRALGVMVGNLRRTIEQVVNSSNRLASSSHEMANSAGQITTSSEKMKAQTGTVAAASEELTVNINTVAASAEEGSANTVSISQNLANIDKDINAVASAIHLLSQSLNEVNQRTQEAVKISNEANKDTESSLASMKLLGEAAQKIGSVVHLISDISMQTKILALNATIEAASAGEAGKGFAVVASEVKNLAQQTAEANNEIGQQIDQIQLYTEQSLSFTQAVSKIVQEVSAHSQSVAESMVKQTQTAVEVNQSVNSIAAASRELSLNVDEAAAGLKEIARSSAELAMGTKEVNYNIHGIQAAISEVNHEVLKSQGQAQGLSQMAQELKAAIAFFKITRNPGDSQTRTKLIE